SWTAKHIMHDLPTSHREAYAQFYRSPCLMANIAVRNWRFLYKMGLSGCRWFGGLGDYVSVRKVALVGNEPSTIGPDSPTVLTIKVLFAQPGLSIAEQGRSEEHTSELQSRFDLVCRLLLEKKKKTKQ